ncbi:MAG: PhzF family phenazine biosynthesis protein [Phenylobacterium sp.]|uniref:PhzF family phenazine biosynthesis protein n=1 Tax=Phenylobacterium sp. TaxID=1871053 RepID=UPI002614DD16|nr:PhzF family phenazine biosynthesis protein [Phenylobacterium sp.]MDB5499536.1 PhzF family phenazine biosynthesis protein [Phenylobacterium sp.]
MPSYDFVTLDVFTDRRFGGNPLAVFPDARGLSDADMQALAAEFNLSETTFVLPPEDPSHTARVRIFNRTAEMPFAGHPNVGTGYVLAGLGRDRDGALAFEELAGLVEVRVTRDASGGLIGAVIDAPRPLALGPELTAAQVAACAGLAPADVVTTAHRPVQASLGVDFFFAEVTEEALARAAPDVAGFRKTAGETGAGGDRLSLFLYAMPGESVRARMFAPLSGTFEDAATGSASATLAALRLSLSGAAEARYEITQGVEMGRPSRLSVSALRGPDGIRASVGGGCVPVFRGEVSL